jgi:hypothetical protein
MEAYRAGINPTIFMRRDKECILPRGLGQPSFPRARRRLASPTRRFSLLFFSLIILSLLCAGILSFVRARRIDEAGFGGARWIWISAAPEPAPAHFSAVREFSLPAAPERASARIFVDRRFALWVNGSPAGRGGQRPGDPPARLEVARFLRKGPNTVAIEAESPDGLGAILFSLETGAANPRIVSGPDWSIEPSGQSLSPSGSRKAAVLGPPPLYPWGYPGRR